MIILSSLAGLIFFIAILSIAHYTQKSHKELVALNRNIATLIEATQRQNSSSPNHAPVPRIKS